ncbi:MAG TPA: MoaD/ThiS family protein [Gemmatimonadaceae bacterium]
MDITVRVFAAYADALGRAEVPLVLPDGATVDDAVRSVSTLPGGQVIPRSPLVAVNHTYASAAVRLNEGDEVALIPPVSGG